MRNLRDTQGLATPGRVIVQAVLLAVLSTASAARSGEWLLVASDEVKRTYVEAAASARNRGGTTRFRMKLEYARPRDMMGLRYDASVWTYVVACDSNRMLWAQQVLVNEDETVWTFPESNEESRADRKMPREVFREVCGRVRGAIDANRSVVTVTAKSPARMASPGVLLRS